MKISIDSGKLKIEGSGLELLKIKTELFKKTKQSIRLEKDCILLPVAFIPFIDKLIGSQSEFSTEAESARMRFHIHAEGRNEVLRIIESGDADKIPEPWLSTLDPAQATAVSAMVTEGILGLCLFDEQGSGKTVMTIAAFDILKDSQRIDSLVVVAPKSMLSEWPKDIRKFLGDKYRITIADGPKSQKYDSAFSDFDILVTNYEGIEVMMLPLLATAEAKQLLLVVDESYYLKNQESLRSENISKLRAQTKLCFVLCGTPAPNSAHDLINQFDLADLGYTFGNFSKSNDRVKDWDEIGELVESRGLFIRRLKSEILEHIPEKQFHVIQVQLKGKQALMYEKGRSELELQLKTFTNETFRRKLTTYFQRRSVLLQICCYPGGLDPTLAEPPAKYEALDKLVEGLISNGRKVIIWSFFRLSLDDLFNRYKNFFPVRVDGTVDTATRREAVRKFQEDKNCMLFVGNPAAAGAGITLHASYDAIYMSYSNQAAHYLQSLDRIHRRGQVSEAVNYYLLICKDTIEETEIIRLRKKEINQNGLMNDNVPWPTSLDDALSELKGHD